MPDFSQKPTDALIDQAEAYLKELWKGAHDDWDKLDSYLLRNYDVWDYENDRDAHKRPDYRPAKPASIVKNAIAQMMAHSPVVTRTKVGTSENSQEDSDKIETGLAAILSNTALKSSIHPYTMAGRYLVHYSYAVMRGPLITSREGYEHTPTSNPIEIEVPNPRTVLMEPLDKNPQYVVRRGTMPAIRMHELSKRKVRTRDNAILFDMEPYKDDQWAEVQYLEWFTNRWHAYRVMSSKNDKGDPIGQSGMLFSEINPIGFVEWTQAFGGFGIMPSTATKFDPKYLARGILWDSLDSLRLHAQSGNAKQQALMDAIFAPLVGEQDQEELENQLRENPEYIQADDPNSIRPLPTNPVPRWGFGVTDEQAQDIQESTIAPSLGGVREPGVVTVGQQDTLDTRARAQFNLPLMELEQMVSVMAERTMELVDNLKMLNGSIGANGHVLRKAWIHGNHNVRVGFEPANPALDLQKRRSDMEEFDRGLLDRETYWERNGDLNTSQMWKRMAKEQVRTSEEMWKQELQDAAEDDGVGEEFARSQQAAEEPIAQPPRVGEGGGGASAVTQPLAPDIVKSPQLPRSLNGVV